MYEDINRVDREAEKQRGREAEYQSSGLRQIGADKEADGNKLNNGALSNSRPEAEKLQGTDDILRICDIKKYQPQKSSDDSERAPRSPIERAMFEAARCFIALDWLGEAKSAQRIHTIKEWARISEVPFEEAWEEVAAAQLKAKTPYRGHLALIGMSKVELEGVPPWIDELCNSKLLTIRSTKLTAALAWQMHLLSVKEGRWFVTTRTLGMWLGLSHEQARKKLAALSKFGIITPVEEGNARKATRHKWSAPGPTEVVSGTPEYGMREKPKLDRFEQKLHDIITSEKIQGADCRAIHAVANRCNCSWTVHTLGAVLQGTEEGGFENAIAYSIQALKSVPKDEYLKRAKYLLSEIEARVLDELSAEDADDKKNREQWSGGGGGSADWSIKEGEIPFAPWVH